MKILKEKNGNVVLIILACVLSVVLVSLVIGAVYISISSDKKSEDLINAKSDISIKENKMHEADDLEEEEVKKLDESKSNIFEKEISINNSYNVKIPIINLTTKYATKVNSEVEAKYRTCVRGTYIVYNYYMYKGMLSLVLDINLGNNLHSYDIYKINLENGKEIKNKELIEKLNLSKEEFIKSVKEACIIKFDDLIKEYKMVCTEESYQVALSKTLKEAEDALNKKIYIDHNGKIFIDINMSIPQIDSTIESIIEL